jgi:hypothetical protein
MSPRTSVSDYTRQVARVPHEASSPGGERTQCGYELQVGSTKHLPPCPRCSNGSYDTVTGGDAAANPYPDRG